MQVAACGALDAEAVAVVVALLLEPALLLRVLLVLGLVLVVAELIIITHLKWRLVCLNVLKEIVSLLAWVIYELLILCIELLRSYH